MKADIKNLPVDPRKSPFCHWSWARLMEAYIIATGDSAAAKTPPHRFKKDRESMVDFLNSAYGIKKKKA